MVPASIHSSHRQRPEFMVRLGLAPPYSIEDVKTAYRDLAKIAHPDHGGSAHEFQLLHEAFDRAQQYLEHRSDRRKWIAKQMESYLDSQRLTEQLEGLGARVTNRTIDWLEKSFGAFAQLTEAVTAVRLENSPMAGELIRLLVDQHSQLNELTRLELPGCQVTDDAILSLEHLGQLQYLDLTGTPVTSKVLPIVKAIPSLNSIALQGTRVGWWSRQKIAREMRHRQQAKTAAFP